MLTKEAGSSGRSKVEIEKTRGTFSRQDLRRGKKESHDAGRLFLIRGGMSL